MKSWPRVVWSRLWAGLRTTRLDREFDEELTTHLELLTEDYRRQGLPPDEARWAAIRKLGRPDLLRELHREQRGLPVFDVLAQDFRYTFRMLRKAPAFAVVVTLSLGLGIGANTALFSVVDNLLLRSLPVRNPDGLVHVQLTAAMAGLKKPAAFLGPPMFEAVRAHSELVSDVVGFNRLDRPVVVVDGSIEPSRQVEQVSANFFRDLGVRPVLGRSPEPSDDAVAIIGYRMWRDRFGASPQVLGRTLTIDGAVYPIVGVAPPRFVGLSIDTTSDIWLSTPRPGPQLMMAHLAPGIGAARAQAAFQVFLPQLMPMPPGAPPLLVELAPAGKGLSQLRTQYERPLLALTALVVLVLLTTCTNVGNLLLLRNISRRREATVRVALGAHQSRLIVQSMVESTVLATLGGALALIFARWGVSAIVSMLPLPTIPDSLTFHADTRTVGFAVIASIVSALLFGLLPAWRASSIDVATSLRSTQGSTQPKPTRRLGRGLVACQVGFSVLLLVGAGLFVQTLRNLATLEIGFDADRVLQVAIDSRSAGYGKGQVGPLYQLLVERIAAIPGVESVAGARNLMMLGAHGRSRYIIPGHMLESGDSWDSAAVGPGFLETLGIPLRRGRSISADDFAQGRNVVVVNEAFARQYFPNEDPIGVRMGLPPTTEIVGIVGNARLAGVRIPEAPMMFEVLRPEPDRITALEVRAGADVGAVARVVREEVQRVNPRLLIGVNSMRRLIDDSIAKERMVAAVSAFFCLLGLLLASVGIFGVASYTVALRTTELGIRMALGAGRWSVIRESLWDTMRVCGIGLAAGIVAAMAAVRLTSSFIADLLYGLTATDAAFIVAAAGLTAAAAVAACVLPARYATRIDPLTAIRCD